MFQQLSLQGIPLEMFAFFAHSKYMPCPECGASLAHEEREEHVCDDERKIDFQMFRLRGRIARFEADLGEFLASPAGRFEAWYAERCRAA
jgi:hypothetical protein